MMRSNWSHNTRRAFAADWRDFTGWCASGTSAWASSSSRRVAREGLVGMSMTSDNGYYVNFLVRTKKWPGSTLNWNRA